MKEQDFYEKLYRDVQDNGLSGWYIKKSHKALEKYFRKRHFAKILEVGGNIGEHIHHVSNNFNKYILTDLRKTGFTPQNSKVEFRVANVEDLPFKNQTFNRTICTCLLHHLTNPKKALEEMRRVTVPSGLISILLPCDPGLAYRFAKSVGPHRAWAKAGISNVDFYHYTQHRNHFPGIKSAIFEVFRTDEVKIRYWPFRFKSWNMNLFTVIQIQITEI